MWELVIMGGERSGGSEGRSVTCDWQKGRCQSLGVNRRPRGYGRSWRLVSEARWIKTGLAAVEAQQDREGRHPLSRVDRGQGVLIGMYSTESGQAQEWEWMGRGVHRV